MEEMGSLWSYQESMDEVRENLLCAIVEYEQFKVEANNELMKKDEFVKQLIQLIENACQERDEARNQLQKLSTKIMPSTNPSEFSSTLPQLQVESPLLKATIPNSSVTESNSFSETYNFNSHSSTPVDSFLNAVSSNELLNNRMADSSNVPFVNQNLLERPMNDHASVIIENLVKGRPLPQKGKLVDAVKAAPPLLRDLLVAGQLPKWRNPPPLQPFPIPPFSVRGGDAAVLSPKPSASILSHVSSGNPSPQTRVQMSCGSSKMLTPVLSFAPSGSCFGSGNMISAGANLSNYVSMSKRQRLH